MAQQSMTSRMWAILSPVLVVVALTALSRVRLEVPRVIIEPPVIETRDRFMSVAVVGDVLWAVGKDGKIIRSEDAGKTWVRQTTGLHTNFQSIAAWDAQKAVVVANEGKGLVTADGGKTWQAISMPVSDMGSGKVLRVRLDPQGRAWAVSEINVILRSVDFGKTWERLTQVDDDVAWNDIAFTGEGTACVVGEFGRLACSADDGVTWEPRPTNVEPSLMSISVSRPAARAGGGPERHRAGHRRWRRDLAAGSGRRSGATFVRRDLDRLALGGSGRQGRHADRRRRCGALGNRPREPRRFRVAHCAGASR